MGSLLPKKITFAPAGTPLHPWKPPYPTPRHLLLANILLPTPRLPHTERTLMRSFQEGDVQSLCKVVPSASAWCDQPPGAQMLRGGWSLGT